MKQDNQFFQYYLFGYSSSHIFGVHFFILSFPHIQGLASNVGDSCTEDSNCSTGQFCEIYSKCNGRGQCKCSSGYKTVGIGCEIGKKPRGMTSVAILNVPQWWWRWVRSGSLRKLWHPRGRLSKNIFSDCKNKLDVDQGSFPKLLSVNFFLLILQKSSSMTRVTPAPRTVLMNRPAPTPCVPAPADTGHPPTGSTASATPSNWSANLAQAVSL